MLIANNISFPEEAHLIGVFFEVEIIYLSDQ